jgi:hypothetical protein
MARKLVISDTVQVPVTVFLSNKTGKAETYKFSLTCKRLEGEALLAEVNSDRNVTGFLAEITSGWSGQTLVVEDDDTPSAFSTDALNDLLGIAGMPKLCLAAYMKEVVAKEKN